MDLILIGSSLIAGGLTGAVGAGSAGSKVAKEVVSFVDPKADKNTAGQVGAIIGGGSGGISGGYIGAATMARFLRD